MIKNVIVINDNDYVNGGAALVAIETANLLFDKGYNVIFFCGVSNPEKSLLNKNIKVIATNDAFYIDYPNKIKGCLKNIYDKKTKKKFVELVKTLNPKETIASIHGFTKALSPSFIGVCHKYGIKTTFTLHDYFCICPNGGLFNYKKNRICDRQMSCKCFFCNCDSRNYLYKMYRNVRFFVQDKVLRFRKRIDYVISLCDSNESYVKGYFLNSKMVRIYNPTSIEDKPERTKCERNSYFIYIGRVTAGKGLEYACETFKDLKEDFYIVGSGDHLERLKKAYDAPNIRFLGWQSHEDTLKLLRGSKGLIFCPLLPEGAPLTIFEAMSQGVPCFVSKYSNGKDFINDQNGYVYDPFSDELKNLINSYGTPVIHYKSVGAFDGYWAAPFTKKRFMDALLERVMNDSENN